MKKILEYWPVIVSVIAVIVWLVRLEMRVMFNRECIIKLNMDNREQFRDLNNNLKESNRIMNTLRETVSELKGMISESPTSGKIIRRREKT